MICKNCNSYVNDSSAFCIYCGAAVEKSEPVNIVSDSSGQAPQTNPADAQYTPPAYAQPQQQAPVYNQQPPVYSQQAPVYAQQSFAPVENNKEEVVKVGSYFGWTILAAIPFIGFIVSIIFACDKSKMNRANFFRSHLIFIAISFVISFLFGLLIGLTGLAFEDIIGELYYYL